MSFESGRGGGMVPPPGWRGGAPAMMHYSHLPRAYAPAAPRGVRPGLPTPTAGQNGMTIPLGRGPPFSAGMVGYGWPAAPMPTALRAAADPRYTRMQAPGTAPQATAVGAVPVSSSAYVSWDGRVRGAGGPAGAAAAPNPGARRDAQPSAAALGGGWQTYTVASDEEGDVWDDPRDAEQGGEDALSDDLLRLEVELLRAAHKLGVSAEASHLLELHRHDKISPEQLSAGSKVILTAISAESCRRELALLELGPASAPPSGSDVRGEPTAAAPPVRSVPSAAGTPSPGLQPPRVSSVRSSAADNSAGASSAVPAARRPYGFLFVCTDQTERECLSRKLLGLPRQHLAAMLKISADTSLFLYNKTSGTLRGVFEMVATPRMDIEPRAWKSFGGPGFPAQVLVKARPGWEETALSQPRRVEAAVVSGRGKVVAGPLHNFDDVQRLCRALSPPAPRADDRKQGHTASRKSAANGRPRTSEAPETPHQTPRSGADGASASNVRSAPRRHAGYVFVCNNRTQEECQRRRLFGDGMRMLKAMRRISADTDIFLLNFETRTIYGVFRAVGKPGANLARDAWGSGSSSQFPAQLRITVPGGDIDQVFRSGRDGRVGFKVKAGPLAPREASKLRALFAVSSHAAPAATSSAAPASALIRTSKAHRAAGGAGGAAGGAGGAANGARSVPRASIEQRGARKPSRKRRVIIDGQNVAFEPNPGGSASDIEKLEIACQHWLRNGHECVVVVPEYFCAGRRVSRDDRSSTAEARLSEDDMRALGRLRSLTGVSVCASPSRLGSTGDDQFVLKLAIKEDGIIISRDNFNDYEASLMEPHRKEAFRAWLRDHIVSFLFHEDSFVTQDMPAFLSHPIVPPAAKSVGPAVHGGRYDARSLERSLESGATPQPMPDDRSRDVRSTAVPGRSSAVHGRKGSSKSVAPTGSAATSSRKPGTPAKPTSKRGDQTSSGRPRLRAGTRSTRVTSSVAADESLDDAELPPVAVCRKQEIDRILNQFPIDIDNAALSDSQQGASASGGAGGRQGRSKGRKLRRLTELLSRKAASRILNTWVFRTKEAASVGAAHGWSVTGDYDPLIPHREDSVKEHVLAQIAANPAVSREDAARFAEEFIKMLETASTKVQRLRRQYIAELKRRRIFNPTDASLGMSMVEARPTGASETVVRITFTDRCGFDLSHSVSIWRSHFDRMARDYGEQRVAGVACRNDRLLWRVFDVVLRYETLAKFSSGLQAALPPRMFKALRDDFGVRHECFASPLNRSEHTTRFGSIFPDTDQFFGSTGSFFSLAPDMGSFEANPPFDGVSIRQCFRYVVRLLRDADERGDSPMSFVIVIGAMVRFDPVAEVDGVSDYLTAERRVKAGDHSYLWGMQHKPHGSARRGWRASVDEWKATMDSCVYWLQNELGSIMWPTTEVKVNNVMRCFRVGQE